MTLSDRLRSVFSINSLHFPLSSTSPDSACVPSSPNPVRGRAQTSASASSTSSIISVPALRLKKTFSNLRGSKQRRKDERYREALAEWALADEREWQYPTWGGPAKKSRKFSKEQRDSLRNWAWDQSQPRSSLEHRPRYSYFDDEISPCHSRHESITESPFPMESVLSIADPFRTASLTSRAERGRTIYGAE
ncbi:hypothetical protein K3495_g13866 [Podosphaera aphanis]|nr:hypothetical protein K3495_g13866 [Podosphaera aphanis]